MIKIVTDSTCDLPPAWLNRYQLTVVPVNIQFGLETFREGQTIGPETFYRRIKDEGMLPTTSQPAVGEFSQIYQSLAADGSEILSIHLTSKLSGTWQSAAMAARQAPDSVKVSVVDSLTSSVGLGLMVREAAHLADSGLAAAEIAAKLEARRPDINVFIMLKDLRYARMSGRVGRLRELLASLLNVKPIVGVDEGALIPLERARSRQKGFERMVAMAAERVGEAPVHVGLAHALARDGAEELLALIQSRLNCQESFIADLALSLAVHFGPGTVGFATYPADQGSR
ncbi:MAG: fatty acid-binding protein DegV [Chloroflexota bacterium]|nr:MAG: fatty acid-binding protein DegV [Chloroflexota bacterium]